MSDTDNGKWDFDDDEERRRAVEAEADGKAREAVANANSVARQVEARFGWVKSVSHLVRTVVYGAALFASFYYTPDFWPGVTRTITSVVEAVRHH